MHIRMMRWWQDLWTHTDLDLLLHMDTAWTWERLSESGDICIDTSTSNIPFWWFSVSWCLIQKFITPHKSWKLLHLLIKIPLHCWPPNRVCEVIENILIWVTTLIYENCKMAITISSSYADTGVKFNCLNQCQCSDWLKAFKHLNQGQCTGW